MSVRSGTVEPAWIAKDGAIVYEDVTVTGTATVPQPPEATIPPLPEEVRDRYRPPGGGFGSQVYDTE